MQKAYGWRTVATVVASSTQGDVTLSQAHSALKDLGLDRVMVPLRGARPVTHLTGCGWNDAVVCRLDLPLGSTLPTALACSRDSQPLPDVRIEMTVTTAPDDTRAGEVWVEDLLPCWRAGGTGLMVVPAPPPPVPTLSDLEISGPAAGEASRTLDKSVDALIACGPGTLVWQTDSDGRPDLIRVGDSTGVLREATSCAQSVLGKVRLSGATTVRATLSGPPPEASASPGTE